MPCPKPDPLAACTSKAIITISSSGKSGRQQREERSAAALDALLHSSGDDCQSEPDENCLPEYIQRRVGVHVSEHAREDVRIAAACELACDREIRVMQCPARDHEVVRQDQKSGRDRQPSQSSPVRSGARAANASTGDRRVIRPSSISATMIGAATKTTQAG